MTPTAGERTADRHEHGEQRASQWTAGRRNRVGHAGEAVAVVEPIDEINWEADDVDPGTTRMLTAEGWQLVEYVDPDDDWALQDDGSWLAPDGITRSWPLVAPEPPGS